MFIYNLKAIAKKMMIDYEEITSRIGHQGEKGISREELLKTYLSQFLPVKYTVGNGIIVDSNENQSKQQDFIIYDGFNSPMMLKMQSLQIIPIESVYCTIEIKSRLTKIGLKKCVENIRSVRELEKCCITNRLLRFGIDKTIGCVFAYTSDISLETICENLNEMNKDVLPEHRISIICILDKGLIFHVSKEGLTNLNLYPNSEDILVMSENSLENNLYSFYLLVLEHLNRCDLLPPNFVEYAKKQNAFNIKPTIKVDSLPDDGYTKIGTNNLNNKDLKTLHAVTKGLQKYMKPDLSKEEFLEMLIDSINITKTTKDKVFHFKNGSVRLEDVLRICDIKNKLKTNQLLEEEKSFYNTFVDNAYSAYKENN